MNPFYIAALALCAAIKALLKKNKEKNDPLLDFINDKIEKGEVEVGEPLIISKLQDKPANEVSDRQDKPANEVSDRQDKPANEVSDRQGKPANEVSDRQGKPANEISTNEASANLSPANDTPTVDSNETKKKKSSINFKAIFKKLSFYALITGICALIGAYYNIIDHKKIEPAKISLIDSIKINIDRNMKIIDSIYYKNKQISGEIDEKYETAHKICETLKIQYKWKEEEIYPMKDLEDKRMIIEALRIKVWEYEHIHDDLLFSFRNKRDYLFYMSEVKDEDEFDNEEWFDVVEFRRKNSIFSEEKKYYECEYYWMKKMKCRNRHLEKGFKELYKYEKIDHFIKAFEEMDNDPDYFEFDNVLLDYLIHFIGYYSYR